MPFNSYIFILGFLPFTLIIYFTMTHFHKITASKWWLVLASLIFYGFYIPRNLPILLISILVNFFISNQLIKKENKILFYIGLSFNLFTLAFFKYNNLGILLPLGISFYTIQQIAFLVDSHQRVIKKIDFLNYLLFVTFFPHLLAGPIVQFKDMNAQYLKVDNKSFNANHFSLGIFLFCVGLSKKVLISDYFMDLANPGFNEMAPLEFFTAWKTSISYMSQLYFDFSGYSDMAMGIAWMFNLKIIQNFNSPLKALNIIDFWNRWHISLSIFIRTYIFTPIAKIFPSMDFLYIMIATFLSMVIAGIWHGAGWTFLIYGALHGLGLVINHIWKKRKIKLPTFLSWFLTINFINITFIIFRSKSIQDAFRIFKGMIGGSGIEIPKIFGIKKVGFLADYGFSMGSLLMPSDYSTLLLLVSGLIIIRYFKNSNEYAKEFSPHPKWAMGASILFVLSLFGMNRITEFIYFNF